MRSPETIFPQETFRVEPEANFLTMRDLGITTIRIDGQVREGFPDKCVELQASEGGLTDLAPLHIQAYLGVLEALHDKPSNKKSRVKVQRYLIEEEKKFTQDLFDKCEYKPGEPVSQLQYEVISSEVTKFILTFVFPETEGDITPKEVAALGALRHNPSVHSLDIPKLDLEKAWQIVQDNPILNQLVRSRDDVFFIPEKYKTSKRHPNNPNSYL